MADDDLLFSTVAELARRLRKRQVSSVELTRLALDRLKGRGRELNAVAEMTEALALEQAETADRERFAGKDRGPLHGIPYGAKDLFAVKGVPTRWGSPAHQDQVFDYDATVIERLREAGAVLVGKLAMIELAGGGGYNHPDASVTGPCRNPHDPSRWAGGSSSGSGAAVGGGLVPFALGTETWGSILVPSAFCGVTGLRPTYGRVSRHGAMTLSWTMDKVGPMARSAEDCGLILNVIAGQDPRDASSATEPFRFSSRMRGKRTFRLGILPQTYASEDAKVAQQRFEDALGVFKALGCEVQDATLPSYPYDLSAGTVITVEGASSFENFIRGPELERLKSKEQQEGLTEGMAVPAVDYLRAMRVRGKAGPEAVKVFETVDALIAPTLHIEAIPLDRKFSESPPWGGNGGPTNLLGWPSLTVPMGPGKEDLPLGLEIIGPPYGENTLLQIGMAFQRETDWHRQRPK